MPQQELEIAFSKKRVEKYFLNTPPLLGYIKHNNNQRISNLYYTPLAVFEIVLRNAVTNVLGKNWRKLSYCEKWENLLIHKKINSIVFTNTRLDELKILGNNIREANGKKRENKNFPMLGFYTRFFDKRNECMFKTTFLIPMFMNIGIEKKEDQDQVLSKIQKNLKLIREVRNRVYHYESLKNKYTENELLSCIQKIYDFVGIFNNQASIWLQKEMPLHKLKKRISDLYNVTLTEIPPFDTSKN